MPRVSQVVGATPRLDRPVLVAVDGVDGSGKTTFAEMLADAYRRAGRKVQVVHLDDFLNPRVIRYRLGRTSPEGFFKDTYDLDAFAAKVLTPLGARGNREIVLRAFDYRADAALDDCPTPVPPDSVVIVEGMFLHRDELRPWWDVSVFLDVPFPVSLRRMAQRDGTDPDPESPRNRRYVEGQRLYIASCTPNRCASFVIDNS